MINRSNIRNLITILVLICTSETSFGQSLTIIGTVKDSLTNTPIAVCNVYLSGTTKGVSTDKEGKFKIDGLKPGNYTLVISHVSYQFSIRDVLLLNGNKDIGTVALLEETTEFEEVEVKRKKDRMWERQWRQFKKMMLGRNYDEKKIKFVNAYVAEFLRMKDGGFTKDEPFTLEILNTHTGYRVYYDVQQFYVGRKYEPFITGYSKFEELEPESELQKAEWEKNRQDAHNGSLRHFFYNIINKIQDDNGYEAYITNDAPFDPDGIYVKKNIFKKRIRKDSIPFRFKIEDTKYPFIKKLTFKDYLHFEYWYEATNEGQTQKTWIKAENDVIYVFDNGVILDPTMVKLYGYLTQEGIYQMLPFDYEGKDN